ncbi:uncharacterized protein LOC131059016 isoform X2 [Cryptomeria japonica]|uniref:uncharacterized protein LOC131059016 isoform X2 n=1 Tax=Cryptomeria japonica TaxID=3369 RepID=UPI0027DA0283|nr:uncharacterized protein LOC131059016 isoform X2 [Cryptomeria japonica]
MNKLRSITIPDCKVLEALDGMEKLRDLSWLQIIRVNPMFKLPDLSRLKRLQHLEIDIPGSQVLDQLGDLTHCPRLREVYIVCPSLLEFPRLKGMKHLEKVEFRLCDKVKGPLDCTDCVKLQSIVLNLCCQMAASPLLNGCKNLSKLILSKCDAVTDSPVVDAPSALKTLELFISAKAASVPRNLESFCELKNLQLWNMRKLMKLPSFKRLSNLTVLELVKCGITEPPDLTGCDSLEDVYFFQLENLVRFPSFSSVRELKKLSLCNCTSVQDPPDIEGCHKLQVFHLLYNDYMKGLPEMNKCAQLEEIQVSWHSAGEVQYRGFNPYSCPANDDLEFCLEHFKDEKFGKIGNVSVPEALEQWQWLKGKRLLVKRYFRGLQLYYNLTAPYEDGPSKDCQKKNIILVKMNGKVTLSPTMAKDSQDRWLKKVEEYFAASAIVTSKIVKGNFAVKNIGFAIVTSKQLERYFTVEDIMPTLVTSKKVEGYFAAKDSAPANVTSANPRHERPHKIVISRLLQPSSQRYHVPAMQGAARMCQELADLFNTVRPNKKGIHIAGVYGMPGQGKTTLGKTFCNLNLSNFDGKVCHLEFCGGNRLQRQKLALQYLTHCGKSHLESLTKEDEARQRLYERVRGQRVLLVLDNITQDSIWEVKYHYLRADLGENSCVLLSARSEDVLAKNFNTNSESRMRIPGLEKEEAIAILLERTSLKESAFGVENRGFALHCANRCSFKDNICDIVGAAHAFHPLALKTFARHLFSKYGAHLSQWVAEADGLVFGSGDGLIDVFIVLDKAFDYMDPRYRIIFMLLTLYFQPIMSPLKVNESLAITCMEKIEYIEKAVQDLRQKGFIEEIEPEIRIHELYVEFAQSKARKMKTWLWCNRDLVTSEYCQHLDLSTIGDEFIKNLWALEIVDVKTKKNCLKFSLMKHVFSVTFHNCEYLEVLGGMENLPYPALLQVGMVPDLKVLNLSSLYALQYLYIDIGNTGELGDLTGCVSLREIHVFCSSLSEFPGINGLQYLENVSFKWCDEMIGPLNCSNCVRLRSIVVENCFEIAQIPLIVGCSNISKIVFKGCYPVTKNSYEDESSALEIQELCISSEEASGARHSECCDGFKNPPLWNIVISRDVPSLRHLSNLTVLKLYKCDISEAPDITYCSMLEEVYFFTLEYLKRFPNFSSLRKLKKLCLCNCRRVQAPPDIGGCQGLRVFHLLYNDVMEKLPQMDGCPLLEEIKLSWHSSSGKAVDSRQDRLESYKSRYNSFLDDNLEFPPDNQQGKIFRNLKKDVFVPVKIKHWQWIQDKTVQVKQYSRGLKDYYCITAPYVP